MSSIRNFSITIFACKRNGKVSKLNSLQKIMRIPHKSGISAFFSAAKSCFTYFRAVLRLWMVAHMRGFCQKWKHKKKFFFFGFENLRLGKKYKCLLKMREVDVARNQRVAKVSFEWNCACVRGHVCATSLFE